MPYTTYHTKQWDDDFGMCVFAISIERIVPDIILSPVFIPLARLMVRFYELLTENDLSILCFGNYNVYQYIVENEVMEKRFGLHHYIPF